MNQTSALLHQLETKAKYLNALFPLGSSRSSLESQKHSKRLSIKLLLHGTEWVGWMKDRKWISRDWAGRMQATAKWEEHEDPVRLKLAE